MRLPKMLSVAHRREDGYSLVISMLLLSIMMVLLTISLEAGNASLRESHLSIEWSKALTVAEAGANQAATLLGQSRGATNPCRIGTSTLCAGGGGEYQMSWATSGGKVLITSTGYYPTQADPTFVRQVQVTYEPVPSFKYAIFSQTALDVHNNMTVIGDIYSSGDITIGQGAEVCGSIISSAGAISLVQSSEIVKADATYGCSGKSGNVWSGGAGGIAGSSQVSVEGNATASNPSTASAACSSLGGSYGITLGGGTMTVAGTAKACGAIAAGVSAPSKTAGVSSSQPTPVTFPAFTFDPNNYSSDTSDPLHLQCFPSTAPVCGQSDATDAVSSFNTYVATHPSNLTGTFAVWQRSPSQSTAINLGGNCNPSKSIAGDFTLITNAPVDFGSTCEITTSAGSADLVVVSTYQPTGSCTAALVNTDGSDCSIYGKNAIEFDRGSVSDPDDGVVGLLYTTGKMAFVNSANNFASTGEGALYAQSMDFKNGYDLVYNSRVERVLGFGVTLERTLWQEINV